MRFLSIFFRFLGIFLIISLIGTIVGREVWLFVGTQQVARTAQRLTQLTRWQPYFSQCVSSILTDEGSPVRGMQVRFISDTEYVTEVACVGKQAIEVDRFTLPIGLKKTTGSAGFFLDLQSQELSGELTIQFFRQNRLVYAEGAKVAHQWGISLLRTSIPASVCTGHGLQCCAVAEYSGVGEPAAAGITDCPGSCFTSCQRRPLLLSFQSDPSFAPTSREVIITKSSEFVTFAYTFDDKDSEISLVQIQYGDGSIGEMTTSSGQFEKQYQCSPGQTCRYVATVIATDARDVSSFQSRLGTITIVMTP